MQLIYLVSNYYGVSEVAGLPRDKIRMPGLADTRPDPLISGHELQRIVYFLLGSFYMNNKNFESRCMGLKYRREFLTAAAGFVFMLICGISGA
jgi:hypothetical protein